MRCPRKNTRQNFSTSKRVTFLVLWVIFIITQLVPVFSAEPQHSSHPSSRVLSRKALVFQNVPFHAAASPSPSPLEAVYFTDKRRIHTGPNPLHN
ncbi:hypothetical protein DCAR_0727061 [Daucus carota subsp. sativus]|uniref:Uncharacterized protein n=1 Tax=Daucus carota subsp. sativus TaxID=79200 RepID=A0AAF1B7L9_DAUCS|nr:hypothetical protein DCAR_0727061 [Daucus carota subsp. sativus]